MKMESTALLAVKRRPGLLPLFLRPCMIYDVIQCKSWRFLAISRDVFGVSSKQKHVLCREQTFGEV